MYKNGQLFQHIDGGFYKFIMTAKFADDSDNMVVYHHVWPFPKFASVRRAAEFYDKFKPIAESELLHAKKTRKVVYQLKISANKANRRGRNT